MNDAFKPVLDALLAHLQATTIGAFTADATADSAELTSVSGLAGLFEGLPVFGPGVSSGTSIASANPAGGTVTLSAPVVSAATGASFATGFQGVSRRLQHWGQVTAQPALFLRRIGATDEFDHDSFFSKTTLECEVWAYCNGGKNPDVAPDDELSVMEQLVRQSFAPDTDYGDPRFTIGGLAYWCRVEGRTDSSPGDQGGQAITRIPVRITLP